MRSIIDRFDLNKRKDVIKKYLKDYLPDKLYILLSSNNDSKEKLEECPFSFTEYNSKKYIVSKYSEIALDIEKNPKIEYLNKIEWIF